jgi:hypothetical protein
LFPITISWFCVFSFLYQLSVLVDRSQQIISIGQSGIDRQLGTTVGLGV